MTEQSPRFTSFPVAVDAGRTVTARFHHASGTGAPITLVLAHGAGAGQASRFMVDFARGLADRGIATVTFDFPYIEARRRVPDRNAVLEATWQAILDAVVERPEHRGRRLMVGGKSMGGRIASQVAAEASTSARIDGLVFLGYPLHPPGRPDQRRDAHLPRITSPMLFVQGERDAFGNAAEMQALVERLPGAELYLVAGANHSLEAPKGAGANRERVYSAVQDHIAAWVRKVIG